MEITGIDLIDREDVKEGIRIVADCVSRKLRVKKVKVRVVRSIPEAVIITFYFANNFRYSREFSGGDLQINKGMGNIKWILYGEEIINNVRHDFYMKRD